MDAGNTEQFFTAKQRLALIARDRARCAASDCDIPAWLCEAHHTLGWENGGPTDLANGVLLCWSHHRLVEHDEWTITRDNHGHPKLVPPVGTCTEATSDRAKPLNAGEAGPIMKHMRPITGHVHQSTVPTDAMATHQILAEIPGRDP